jgi:hypothetical protein
MLRFAAVFSLLSTCISIYIYKGHDCVSVSVDPSNSDVQIDEIKQYRNARCITAIEAMYRLYAFPLYSMSPPVLQMQVHLPGMHMASYKSRDDLNKVVQSERAKRSMLTEYFSTNMENPAARK